jgi:hypothetical protein
VFSTDVPNLPAPPRPVNPVVPQRLTFSVPATLPSPSSHRNACAPPPASSGHPTPESPQVSVDKHLRHTACSMEAVCTVTERRWPAFRFLEQER